MVMILVSLHNYYFAGGKQKYKSTFAAKTPVTFDPMSADGIPAWGFSIGCGLEQLFGEDNFQKLDSVTNKGRSLDNSNAQFQDFPLSISVKVDQDMAMNVSAHFGENSTLEFVNPVAAALENEEQFPVK